MCAKVQLSWILALGHGVVSYGKRDLSVWERRSFPRICVQDVMETCQNPTCNHHSAWLHYWELILGTMTLFKLGRQWRVTGTRQRPPPICPMMAPLGKKGDSAGLDGIEHVNEWAKVSQPLPSPWAQKRHPESGRECVPLKQLTEKGGTVTVTEGNRCLGAVESKWCQP